MVKMALQRKGHGLRLSLMTSGMSIAIELDENFVQVYTNRGAVKSDLGNYDDALIDLNKGCGGQAIQNGIPAKT